MDSAVLQLGILVAVLVGLLGGAVGAVDLDAAVGALDRDVAIGRRCRGRAISILDDRVSRLGGVSSSGGTGCGSGSGGICSGGGRSIVFLCQLLTIDV